MNKFFLFASAILSIILLPGCYSVKSVVDRDFHQQIQRVFMQANSHEGMKGFFHEMGTRLVTGLRADSIDAKLKELDPLTLEGPSEILKEVDEYHADVILMLGGETKLGYNAPRFVPTGMPGGGGMWMGGGGTTTDGSEIEIGMYLPHKDHAVWKATVSISTGGFGAGSAVTAAEKVISKLEEDGLIHRTIAPADSAHTN